MNTDASGVCPVPNCPDNYGTLPACAGLAVPYVPFQQNTPKQYGRSEALSNGTLYPGLNLPFHLKAEGSALPSTPMTELQALEFVRLELGLYLDTHPEDQEALTLLGQICSMEKDARASYERRFGPLTMCADTTGSRYRWLNDPWPWNYQQNEVK